MTYTVLLADPESAVVGIGTASRSRAVGGVVPRIDHRVGGAASQGWTNALATAALTALSGGADVDEAVAQAISGDEGRDYRQVGVIDRAGRTAAHTGSRCTPWAGQLLGPGYVLVGNILAGPGVLRAAQRALAGALDPAPPSRTVPFIDRRGETAQISVPFGVARVGLRLLAALRAAEGAGGDARGRQSAALLVRRMGPEAATALTEIDLRVDDAVDPLPELALMLDRQLYGAHDLSVPTG